MNAAGLANFEEGDLDGINPELALHEQADRLPYNRKFEFSKEKLKLGKESVQKLRHAIFGFRKNGLCI